MSVDDAQIEHYEPKHSAFLADVDGLEWFERIDFTEFEDPAKVELIFARLSDKDWDAILDRFVNYDGVSVYMHNILPMSVAKGHERLWPDKIWDRLFSLDGWAVLCQNMLTHNGFEHMPDRVLAQLPMDFILERDSAAPFPFGTKGPYHFRAALMENPDAFERLMRFEIWARRADDFKTLKIAMLKKLEEVGQSYAQVTKERVQGTLERLSQKLLCVQASKRRQHRVSLDN